MPTPTRTPAAKGTRNWILAVFPLFLAVLIVGFQLVAVPGGGVTFYRIPILGVKLLAGIGCLAAALQFSRDDYLFKVWLLAAIQFFLLVAQDALVGTSTHLGVNEAAATQWQDVTRFVLFTGANVCGVAAVILYSRAVHVAGLSFPGSRGSKYTLTAAAVLVAVLCGGYALRQDLSAALHGSIADIGTTASDVADMTSFVLLAPLLLTVLSLRGGLWVWPCALYTAGTLGWLFFDSTSIVGHLLQVPEPRLLAFEELFRAAACAYFFCAGIAQWWAIRSMRATLAAPAKEAAGA